MRRRKFWGWGYEHEGLNADELNALAGVVAGLFGLDDVRPIDSPDIS